MALWLIGYLVYKKEVDHAVDNALDRIKGFFSKDAEATQFLEKFPGVGYAVAVVHEAAGNSDEAKRAAVRATAALVSVISSAAGTAGGAAVAGPGGAVAGAALGEAVGIALKKAIAQYVEDDKLRAELEDVTAAGVIVDIALAGAGGGAGSVGKAISKELEQKWLSKLLTSQGLVTLFERLPKYMAHTASAN